MTAITLHDGQFLGDHGGGADEEVQAVDAIEPLVRKGDLAHLSRLDEGQHAVCAVMDDLLVELTQQGGSDTAVPPLRVERQRQQVCIAAGHAGDGHADQLARGECHRGRLLLVERLDDIATAVRGRHRGPGEIDQTNDLLHRCERIAVVQREDTPTRGQQVTPGLQPGVLKSSSMCP